MTQSRFEGTQQVSARLSWYCTIISYMQWRMKYTWFHTHAFHREPKRNYLLWWSASPLAAPLQSQQVQWMPSRHWKIKLSTATQNHTNRCTTQHYVSSMKASAMAMDCKLYWMAMFDKADSSAVLLFALNDTLQSKCKRESMALAFYKWKFNMSFYV